MTSTEHVMNRIHLIAKRLLRWSVGGLSLFTAMVMLFLGGYWIGWKTEAKDVPATERKEPGAPARPLTVNPPAKEAMPMSFAPELTSTSEVQEAVGDRVVRLAKWLGGGRDARMGGARVTAEIAEMSLAEAWKALEQLHHAPDTAVVATLRAKLLLRWAAFDPAGAFEYWRGSVKSLRWPGSLNHRFFNRWAKTDALGALNGWKTLVAEKGIPDHDQGFPLRQIVGQMAAQDLRLAAQQAGQIEGRNRKEALRGLGELASRPEYRAALLGELSAWPPGEDRDRALTAAVASWGCAGEVDQAMAWLDASGVARRHWHRSRNAFGNAIPSALTRCCRS